MTDAALDRQYLTTTLNTRRQISHAPYALNDASPALHGCACPALHGCMHGQTHALSP